GGRVLFPFIGGGKSETRFLQTVLPERGRRIIGPARVCSVFPFNFFIRCRGLEKTSEVIVFPQVRKCGLWSPLSDERRRKGERISGKAGYEGEVTSFRNYAQGDPLKYIHWKASAKSGDLKTKELSSLAQQPVVIDLDGMQAENIEAKVSCAAYLVLGLFRRGIPVGLRINGVLLKAEPLPSHKIKLLRELALYGLAPEN
ncbi:MAG TPA: DUF58 domain-containing protein, partial [Dissulfurispiraceae bacterium]